MEEKKIIDIIKSLSEEETVKLLNFVYNLLKMRPA
jgi:hypothetical protein